MSRRRRRGVPRCEHCKAEVTWLPTYEGRRQFDLATPDTSGARPRHGGRLWDPDVLARELGEKPAYIATLPHYVRHWCAERAAQISGQEFPR